MCIVGDKPVRAIDSLAATPSIANDAAARIAPTVADGAGQSATAAAAIAAVAENPAIAVKHVVPREVTWSNTVDTAEQIAAARKRFGGAGPPGTARKPATAANAVAVTPRTNDGSGPVSTRLVTIDPAVAARATAAAMTARVLAGELPHQLITTAPQPTAHKHAKAPKLRATPS